MKLNGYELTPREVEVLWRLHQAKTNREIGSELGISEATVKVHVRAIMKKMGVHTRLQIVVRTMGK